MENRNFGLLISAKEARRISEGETPISEWVKNITNKISSAAFNGHHEIQIVSSERVPSEIIAELSDLGYDIWSGESKCSQDTDPIKIYSYKIAW